MTRDDLQELAQKVGMVKTPQGTFKPLWMASDDQLMAFAKAIVADVKQSASEFVVQAIKKAVDYEREQCARLCDQIPEDDLYTGGQYAAQIRARGEK